MLLEKDTYFCGLDFIYIKEYNQNFRINNDKINQVKNFYLNGKEIYLRWFDFLVEVGIIL